MVFMVSMVVALVEKYNKARPKQSSSPQELQEDVFPEIELQEEEIIAQPQRPSTFPKRSARKKEPMPQLSSHDKREETPRQKKRIDLRHRDEAKRAFIYSEIFNRKY